MPLDDWQRVRTTACLELVERFYDKARPWDVFKKAAKRSPEINLVRIADAIKTRNKSRFFSAVHPVLGSEPKLLNEQWSAYSDLSTGLQFDSVKGYVKFGEYLVYVVSMAYGKEVFDSSYAFALDQQGKYRFLPYNVEDLLYKAVMEWGESDWGWGNQRTYCSGKDVERTNMRIPFSQETKYKKHYPKVMLKGHDVTSGNGNSAPVYRKITKQISNMFAALIAGDVEHYYPYLTKPARAEMRKWYPEATDVQIARFVQSFEDVKPVFVLDADPMYIVYVQTAAFGIRAMFMLDDGKGRYIWTNSSHITPLDAIFKQSMVKKAAAQKIPFQYWRN